MKLASKPSLQNRLLGTAINNDVLNAIKFTTPGVREHAFAYYEAI